MTRPRRATKRVDYSGLAGGVEEDEEDSHYSDEEVHSEEDDDAEEFAPGQDEEEEDEDEAVGDEDAEESDADVVHVKEEPRARKKVKSKSAVNWGRSNGGGDAIVLQRQQTKASSIDTEKSSYKKSDNLRERLELFHGKNSMYLVDAIKQRSKWDTCAFVPDHTKMECPDSIQNLGKLPDVAPKHEQQFEKDQMAEPYLSHALNVVPYHDAAVAQLQPQEGLGLPSGGYIVNVGGMVTCAKWAPGLDQSTQYLAVATVPFQSEDLTSAGDESEFAARLDLALFNRNAEGPGIVQIYEYVEGKTCSLVADFRFPNAGHATYLEWRPSGPHTVSGNSNVGTLAVRFTDGCVRAIVISLQDLVHQPKQTFVTSPKLELSLPTAISTFTWRTPNIISAACVDGYVGEFHVVEDEVEMPVFLFPAHSSAILTIKSAFPDYPQLLFTGSADGYLRLTDVGDLKRSRVYSSRSKTYTVVGSFTRFMNSFIASEDFILTKMYPIRSHSHQSGATSLTKHEGSVMATATSVLHPIFMSGAGDGTVQVGNVVRRIGGRMKKSPGATNEYQYATLWKLEYSEKHNLFRFTDISQATVIANLEGHDRPRIFPKAAVVSTTDWVPSKTCGSVYCAGMICGLIRIEDVAKL